jgi:hypothetical protein
MYIKSKAELDKFVKELQTTNKRTSKSIGNSLYLDYASANKISYYYYFQQNKKQKKSNYLTLLA